MRGIQPTGLLSVAYRCITKLLKILNACRLRPADAPYPTISDLQTFPMSNGDYQGL